MPRLRSCEDTALGPAAKLPGGPQGWATRPGSSHTKGGGRGGSVAPGEADLRQSPTRGLFLLAFVILGASPPPPQKALSSFHPLLCLPPCLQPPPTS